ncbi:MAG: hypothetical protein K2L54_02250, partial [Clostridiales bacterium]|nr:hypothetical protein [Clostridiales bacterium]
MKMSSVAKSAAIALLAIAIAPQTVIVPKTSHDRSSEFVVKSKSVGRNIALETDKLNDYEQDQVEYLIMQIINSDKNTVELDGVYYTYSDLYRSPEEKSGYVIDFTYGEAYGYMLIISDGNSVSPAEVVLQRRSPYYGKEGKYLYPPNGGYYI